MQFAEARSLAIDICYKLQQHCDKINLAGGVRRRKPDCHDIEVICLPKHVITKDLFDNPLDSIVDPEFTRIVHKELGKVMKGKSDGRMMQIKLPQNIMLDLFIPQPDDYFRQYAIRTGSADFSHAIIASAWKREGWVGTHDGLRRIDQCISKDNSGKPVWICTSSNPTLPPVWKSEEEFFEFIKVKFVPPHLRNYTINKNK
jgi:DNA polymerase/3'-5' exonuclease PolX